MSQLHTTRYCAGLTTALLSTGWLGATVALPGSALAGAQASGPLQFTSEWRVTLASAAAAPAAFDEGRAYVPLLDGTIAAIDLVAGETAWTAEATTGLALGAGGGHVVVASGRDVRALDVATGRDVWRARLDAPVTAAPLVDTGWVFVGLEGDRVAALRAADGALQWTLATGAALRAPPAPAAGRVYLPLADGRIVAADLETGTIAWSRVLPAPPTGILPLDDRLFVGADDNYFYCLRLDNGEDRWRVRTGGDIAGAPIVDESHVYVMSLDNMLRALDRGNGAVRWQQPVPTRTIGGPLRSAAFIFVGSLTPRLYAYGRRTGASAGSSAAPVSDALASALVAPPRMVTHGGRDAFVLLTRQGVLELITYAENG